MHAFADERMTSADAAAALGIQGESRLKQKVGCVLLAIYECNRMVQLDCVALPAFNFCLPSSVSYS